MKRKQIVAMALSMSMAAGSSMMAFAADLNGADEGTGEVQYVEKSDVFNVVLPTDAGSTFDYLLDPEGLIKIGITARLLRMTRRFISCIRTIQSMEIRTTRIPVTTSL